MESPDPETSFKCSNLSTNYFLVQIHPLMAKFLILTLNLSLGKDQNTQNLSSNYTLLLDINHMKVNTSSYMGG